MSRHTRFIDPLARIPLCVKRRKTSEDPNATDYAPETDAVLRLLLFSAQGNQGAVALLRALPYVEQGALYAVLEGTDGAWERAIGAIPFLVGPDAAEAAQEVRAYLRWLARIAERTATAEDLQDYTEIEDLFEAADFEDPSCPRPPKRRRRDKIKGIARSFLGGLGYALGVSTLPLPIREKLDDLAREAGIPMPEPRARKIEPEIDAEYENERIPGPLSADQETRVYLFRKLLREGPEALTPAQCANLYHAAGFEDLFRAFEVCISDRELERVWAHWPLSREALLNAVFDALRLRAQGAKSVATPETAEPSEPSPVPESVVDLLHRWLEAPANDIPPIPGRFTVLSKAPHADRAFLYAAAHHPPTWTELTGSHDLPDYAESFATARGTDRTTGETLWALAPDAVTWEHVRYNLVQMLAMAGVLDPVPLA